MSLEDETQLLAELENLLKKQTALARRGGLASVEQLALQGEPLVRKISDLGVLGRPEHLAQRARIERLYKELFFILAADKSATSHQIKLLRQGRQTLEVYRKST